MAFGISCARMGAPAKNILLTSGIVGKNGNLNREQYTHTGDCVLRSAGRALQLIREMNDK
jgi:hypothetical protein